MEKEANKRFRVTALGCRTNQYEAQAFQDQLGRMGYVAAKEGEEADVCIVNTCTVTESADSSSRNEVRRLINQNPGAKVLVTGCYAERDPDQIRSIEGVDAVVPNAEKEIALQALFPDEDLPEFSIERFDAHTRAFVKVQDGCNSYCTYCIIPYVRGRSRSRNLSDILEEVKSLVKSGYKEIVLTGINIGDFDGDPKEEEKPVSLAQLVRAVDQVPGVERIRVSSIDPDEVDDDLLDAIVNGAKTCQSMHIVLQSGSNVVLKRMNRKYTKQMFMETVDRLKDACPDFTFTTDVIVGFPGELESDHQDTLDILRHVRFAKVHMFPYSSRPRTRAATYPNQIDSKEKQRRKQEVLHLSEQLAYELREKFVGKEMSVLTESVDSENRSTKGHTDNFLPVLLQGCVIPANELIQVRLIENTPRGLIGEVLPAHADSN